MKPNVFLVGLLGPFGLEDQLTAYWDYVLSAVPRLGQAFVDEVCRLSELKPSTFVGAIPQPVGDAKNHPDLLLQCRDYSILFEHKIDSALGPRQLHRYLTLAKARGWKLALLAARRTDIDDEVGRAREFVYPKARAGHHTFCGRIFNQSLVGRDIIYRTSSASTSSGSVSGSSAGPVWAIHSSTRMLR